MFRYTIHLDGYSQAVQLEDQQDVRIGSRVRVNLSKPAILKTSGGEKTVNDLDTLWGSIVEKEGPNLNLTPSRIGLDPIEFVKVEGMIITEPPKADAQQKSPNTDDDFLNPMPKQ